MRLFGGSHLGNPCPKAMGADGSGLDVRVALLEPRGAEGWHKSTVAISLPMFPVSL